MGWPGWALKNVDFEGPHGGLVGFSMCVVPTPRFASLHFASLHFAFRIEPSRSPHADWLADLYVYTCIYIYIHIHVLIICKYIYIYMYIYISD